jgi:hypothetical protein
MEVFRDVLPDAQYFLGVFVCLFAQEYSVFGCLFALTAAMMFRLFVLDVDLLKML